ncbi:hypothetical protein IU449_24490 [Nocardia higoensis]|uniref:Tox-MPTase5 domain-containing protein n=1 Tax=Nocardia higoensis TaxID=228599 RepID=A0ABS0DGR3_9NOCA|nr:hypothetical protein [Nocardia higoensis]MBF6357668.1 hypothetical protein [Nocardia higoensis]
MTNSIAPQIYRPPWVEARIDAFRRMTAGGLADAPTEPTSVTTFHNMTPQSAARRLERIRAADALTITADAVQSMLSPAQSKLTFVDEPIGEYHKPSTRQKLPAPSPPAPQQSGVDQLPPVVNPNAPRPTQWDGPLPELPSQQNDESAATPSPSGTTPIPVLPEPARAEDASEHVFGLPDVTGHTPGDTWDETLPNGITRTNTIPLGNGLNTVDQVIHNADGTITYSRVVSDGRGGYQRWNNDSTGTASYYNSGDPGAMGFGQHFMPGTSTSGTPDREFGTTPGWAEVVSPSYDADGNLVGYDVGVPNAEGLYDNIHYDNYGNRTVTTAAPNGHGGVTSRFFEQVDSEGNGWRIGPDDERWTMALDSHGNPVMMRTRDHEDGVLLSRIDHTGLRTDEFRGVDGEWFRDTTTPDGRITRLLRDFTRITFDADGAEIARQGRPDTRAAWEKAAGFGLAFGKGVANGALGLVEFAGALSGVNAQINLVGELFGKNPNLTTLPEAVIGLGRTVVDVAVADYRAWTTTSSELGAFLSGEQGWDETWDEASRAIGNSYNEMSKLVIGTDWTGFSEHPAETLGNASFGIALLFGGGKARGSVDATPSFRPSSARGIPNHSRGRALLHNQHESLRKLGSASETRPVEAKNVQHLEHSGHTSRNAWGELDQIERATGSSSLARRRALEAILNSPDFNNFRFTHRPVYSPTVYSGMARQNTGIQIGRIPFSSRLELRRTIVHEELHHRWFARGRINHHPRDGNGTSKLFYDTVNRYLEFRGWM